jgi:crossover junction endodeoxyribonuclease RuvC
VNRFLAIDPGANGAIARFADGRLREVIDLPGRTSRLRIMIQFPRLEGVVLEQVNGIPGQSAPAAFTFGRIYGEIRGVCDAEGVPIVDVHPSVWKGALGLRKGLSETKAQSKSRSRALAAEIFPDFAGEFARARDEGKAEAALIGHWYLTKGQS